MGDSALSLALTDIRRRAAGRLVVSTDSFENAERNLLAIQTCDALLARLHHIHRVPAVSRRAHP